MFCFCANNYAVEILMQETPIGTYAENVIKAPPTQSLKQLVMYCKYNYKCCHLVIEITIFISFSLTFQRSSRSNLMRNRIHL